MSDRKQIFKTLWFETLAYHVYDIYIYIYLYDIIVDLVKSE